jgi:hypothetical protein
MKLITASPGSRCPRCRRCHRTWHALASCIWQEAAWVVGDRVPRQGPCYAVLARCGALTVTLWPSLAEAEERRRIITSTGCGGCCRRAHSIVRLAERKVKRLPGAFRLVCGICSPGVDCEPHEQAQRLVAPGPARAGSFEQPRWAFLNSFERLASATWLRARN